MRIEEVLKESEADDQMYRQKASQLYSQIVQRLPDVPITQYKKARMGGQTAFMLSVRELGVNDDMNVVVAPSSIEPGAVGGYDQNSDNMFIFMDMKDFTMSDGSFERKLNSRELRRTIVHELIHKFDAQRTNYQRRTSELSKEEYYNSPDEYNAYYQEAIQEIEQMISRLKGMGRQDVIENRFGEFEDFMDYMMKEVFDSSFVKYMNQDTKRRLQKRLFRFWKESVEPELV